MQHEEGRFTGASGQESYWQAWLPAEPKAVVVLAHGVSEHTGRYLHVARRLVEAGYALYGIDHYGHGLSGGTKGDIGKLSWVVDDFHALRTMAEAEHPGLPVFVLGHSLGGLIALDYVTSKGQEGLAGLALSAPAVDVSVANAVERALAPLLSKVVPMLGIVDLGIDNISRDPSVVAAYRNDPLVYTGKVRARTGAESLAGVQRVTKRLSTLTLPVLVMHGSEDKLAAPAGGRQVYDGVRSEDRSFKLYTGLYHEIFNEPEQDEVLTDLVTWLDQHSVVEQ